MIVVGLETSSASAGIAVIRDQEVMADATLEIGAVYAEQLPAILERTMGELDLQWSAVDGFAISIGPGSYTGLRVGLSLVKGLAYVTKRPVAAVPTLDAIAFQVPFSRYPVHVLTDARRGQVYEARYETGEGRPKRGSAITGWVSLKTWSHRSRIRWCSSAAASTRTVRASSFPR